MKGKADIIPGKSLDVQVITHARDIHVYYVAEPELEELLSGYNPIYLSLFTLCVGVFFGFLVSLFTTQLSDRMFAVFIAILFVSFLMAILFGSRALRERKKAEERVKSIKENRKI